MDAPEALVKEPGYDKIKNLFKNEEQFSLFSMLPGGPGVKLDLIKELTGNKEWTMEDLTDDAMCGLLNHPEVLCGILNQPELEDVEVTEEDTQTPTPSPVSGALLPSATESLATSVPEEDLSMSDEPSDPVSWLQESTLHQ
jgi:hypothetical protein